MSQSATPALFARENYRWMLLGLLLITAGMILMAGGKSNTDPTVFNKAAVYSVQRITIAPMLILAGLVVEIIAIFREPKKN